MSRLGMRWIALGAPYAWYGFAKPIEDHDLRVGRDFFRQYARRVHAAFDAEKKDAGLITREAFGALRCKRGFNPEKVAPVIRDFYEHTSAYALKLSVHWNPLIQPLGLLYHWLLANHLDQLNVPPLDTDTMQDVESHVEFVDVDHDGHPDLRCWVRVVKRSNVLFYVGAFYTYKSTVGGRETAYLSGTFPLSWSNLTVALKVDNLPGGGLLLSSRHGGATEAGSYLLVPHRSSFSMMPALGLAETFHFLPVEGDATRCKVIHDEYWLGIHAFRLTYDIRRKRTEVPFGSLRRRSRRARS